LTGTAMVKNINPGLASSSPASLMVSGGVLYFAATVGDGGSGRELWKSDGTLSGTVLVKDISAGTSSSNPASLVDVNGTLYFTATDGTNGVELWKSDGTNSGTVLVKDIHTSGASSPSSLVNVGGTLYFTATEGTNGTELWKSDGSTSGTVLVKDIHTSGSSNPASLIAYDGLVFFAASDGANGVELWTSDGTSAGTFMVTNIASGSGSSNPSWLTTTSDDLFFSANDGTHGGELWRLGFEAPLLTDHVWTDPLHIDLSWAGIFGADGYLVERTWDGSNYETVTITGASTFTANIYAVPGYYASLIPPDFVAGSSIRIRAYSEEGVSEASNTITPDQPTQGVNFTATATGTTSATLDWDHNPAIAAGFPVTYIVTMRRYYNTDFVMIGSTTSTTFNVSGLEPETQYDFILTPSTVLGYGYGFGGSVTTDDEVGEPDSPTLVETNFINNGMALEVTWDDVSDETGYIVELFSEDMPLDAFFTGWQEVTSTGANEVSAIVLPNYPISWFSGLSVRVRAVNAAGKSDPEPGAVQAIGHFAFNLLAPTAINFQWNIAEQRLEITSPGYAQSVEVRLIDHQGFPTITTIPPNETSWIEGVDFTVPGGLSRNIKVSFGTQRVGSSGVSLVAVDSIITYAPPDEPEVAALALDTETVLLTWTNVPTAGIYDIEGIPDYPSGVTVYDDRTFYLARGFTPGPVTPSLEVRANDGFAGVSDWVEAEWDASTPGLFSVHDAPDALVGTRLSATSARLIWADQASDETHFEVWYSLDGTSYSLFDDDVDADTLEYVAGGLTNGQTYYFKIKAIGAADDSDFSDVITVPGT
jgi:ELWxxDGT repeat protein